MSARLPSRRWLRRSSPAARLVWNGPLGAVRDTALRCPPTVALAKTAAARKEWGRPRFRGRRRRHGGGPQSGGRGGGLHLRLDRGGPFSNGWRARNCPASPRLGANNTLDLCEKVPPKNRRLYAEIFQVNRSVKIIYSAPQQPPGERRCAMTKMISRFLTILTAVLGLGMATAPLRRGDHRLILFTRFSGAAVPPPQEPSLTA